MIRVLLACVRPVAGAALRLAVELGDAGDHWAVGLGCPPTRQR